MQPIHWAIVITVAIVLFGARRLPEAARGLGRSARILKAEIASLHNGDPEMGSSRSPTDSTPTVPSGQPAPDHAARHPTDLDTTRP